MLDSGFVTRTRVAVLVVSIVATFSFFATAAARDEVAIMSEEELVQTLESADRLGRRPGVSCLRRLGPSHLELVSSFIEHEHYDVREAAFAVLGRIGDDRAKGILRSALADTAALRRSWSYIGQALLAARDREALPMLREFGESHPNEYIRRGCMGFAREIESSTWDEPPLTVECGRVECNFLLDDIECICVRTPMWGFVRMVSESDYRDVCTELRSVEKPPEVVMLRVAGSSHLKPHVPMIHTAGHLHIELFDGRVGMIEIGGGGEFRVGSHSFMSARLDEIVGEVVLPSPVPGRVRRCSDLLPSESSN